MGCHIVDVDVHLFVVLYAFLLGFFQQVDVILVDDIQEVIQFILGEFLLHILWQIVLDELHGQSVVLSISYEVFFKGAHVG